MIGDRWGSCSDVAGKVILSQAGSIWLLRFGSSIWLLRFGFFDLASSIWLLRSGFDQAVSVQLAFCACFLAHSSGVCVVIWKAWITLSSSSRMAFTMRCLLSSMWPSNAFETITQMNFAPQPSETSSISCTGRRKEFALEVWTQKFKLRGLNWKVWIGRFELRGSN